MHSYVSTRFCTIHNFYDILTSHFICCFKFVYSMEMTSHSERLGMGTSRIVASSIRKNSNMLLLFTLLIFCFKYVYLVDMAIHSKCLGAFRIVASSTSKNSILFDIVIQKSHLESNNVQAYINEPPLGWYTTKSFQSDVPNNFLKSKVRMSYF